eukprot:4641458-Pyramimonas_sp.AAC.1
MSVAAPEFKPKDHLFVHLTLRIPRYGNPRYYSTFHDESLNLCVARIANVCHRHVWEESIFNRLRLLPIVEKSSAWAADDEEGGEDDEEEENEEEEGMQGRDVEEEEREDEGGGTMRNGGY